MIKWAQFLPEVLPQAPGAPNQMATNAVRNSAIQFAEQSVLLRKNLALINVILGLQDYPVAAGDQLRTVTVLRVLFDGRAALPFQEDVKNRNTVTDTESPYRYNLIGTETIHLEWAPVKNITDGLSVRVAYKPSHDATECDDILYDDWLEQISAGALWRLQRMPGKQWSDANAALRNHALFKAGMNQAWGRASKSHTSSVTRVQFTPSSGGGRRVNYRI